MSTPQPGRQSQYERRPNGPQPNGPQMNEPQSSGRPSYGPPPGYPPQPSPGHAQPPPAYGQQPPPYGPPPAGGPPPRRGTNGFAIAALVLGILGGVVLSVIFGFVALSQIKRTGQSGRGLAIAGLVLSGVWILAIATAVTVAIATGATRNPSGQITTGGSVSATSLRVGDCIDTLADSTRVASLSAVPCGQPHEGEVYAVFDLPAGDYPGVAAVTKQVEAQCADRLGGYAPKAVEDPSIGIYFLYPFEQNWRAGDREAVCLATTTPATTGSLRQR